MDKIVFLTLSLTRGGAERVISNMCNEYFVKKYEVTIISLMAAKPEYELDSRIRFITLDDTTEQYKEGLGKRFLRRRSALKKVLRNFSKDNLLAIYSFLPEPNMILTSLSGMVKCPIIISVRNDPVKEYGSIIRKLLMKALYPRADYYVFQTEMARDYFRFSKHIMECSSVIPNPINRDFINVERATNRKKEIVAVGRLEKQKDPLLLLQAFSKVHERFQDYTLSFYGEGSMREELQSKAEALGIADSVILHGNTTDVKQAIWDASVYVLPSIYEGMPNALMEAMALGLPCIATDCPCGGPAYLIQDEINGKLIQVGAEEELVDALLYVLEHEEYANRLGSKAQEICERLDPDKIVREWEKLCLNFIEK